MFEISIDTVNQKWLLLLLLQRYSLSNLQNWGSWWLNNGIISWFLLIMMFKFSLYCLYLFFCFEENYVCWKCTNHFYPSLLLHSACFCFHFNPTTALLYFCHMGTALFFYQETWCSVFNPSAGMQRCRYSVIFVISSVCKVWSVYKHHLCSLHQPNRSCWEQNNAYLPALSLEK